MAKTDRDPIEHLGSAGFSTYTFVCYVDHQPTVAYTAGSTFLPRVYAPSAEQLRELCARRVRHAARERRL
jgi:hypothetical protein